MRAANRFIDNANLPQNELMIFCGDVCASPYPKRMHMAGQAVAVQFALAVFKKACTVIMAMTGKLNASNIFADCAISSRFRRNIMAHNITKL